MSLDVEKLKAAINKRREYNMKNMDSPNLINNGLVIVLELIDQIAADPDSEVMSFGAFMSFTRDELRTIKNDPKNLIIQEPDEFTKALEPFGYPGDVLHVIEPDGVEMLCVEESIANAMIASFGKSMVESGKWTQEECEKYLSDPYIDSDRDYSLNAKFEVDNDKVVPLWP